MAKIDCSELAQTITDLLEVVSADPDVKSFDDAVLEMQKDSPSLTREFISEAVIEATESKRKSADALSKKIRGIKSEPGIEKKTKQKVNKLNRFLEGGVLKADPKQRKIGSQTIESLRKTSKNLTRWFKNNNPTAFKRLQKKLAELQDKIETGDIDPQRQPQTEFREPIKQLQEQINQARKTIIDARAISTVEKQIDTLNKHLDEGTLPESAKADKFVSEPMRLAREIRDDLKKKLAKSEPAQKERLEAQIETLTKRLKSGDILPKTKPVDVPQSKELERMQFERDQLQREIRRQITNLKPTSLFQRLVQNPFNAARNIMTSFDFSAVFRQGGFIILGHPIQGVKTLVPMFKAFMSEQNQAKIEKSIQDRPNAPLYRKAGLFIAPTDGSYKLGAREEAMQTNIFDNIPGGNIVKRILTAPIRASNRAYATFLNVLRADSFDIMAAGLSKDADVTLNEAKAVAKFVNTATGRGTLGVFENAAEGLNVVFFAPRYVASRFQLLGGAFAAPIKAVAGKNKKVQQQIVKEYARYLIGMTAVYALAALTLDDVEFEWNPTSPDFGKIRIGKTRLDPLSGISQVTVLLSRLIKGEIKSSTTGKITPIRGENVGFGIGKAGSVIGRFLRYKLSPMFGTALNLLEGEDPVGQPFGIEDLPESLLIPLALREVFETIEEQGLPRGTALSTLAIFGMGIQTYGSSLDRFIGSLKDMTVSELKQELKDSRLKTKRSEKDPETGKKTFFRKGSPKKGKAQHVEALEKEINRRKTK